jgi:hypothetical protein
MKRFIKSVGKKGPLYLFFGLLALAAVSFAFLSSTVRADSGGRGRDPWQRFHIAGRFPLCSKRP